LGRDVAGSETTVGSFSRNDCSSFMKQYYTPDRVVVTVAGGVELEHCRGVVNEVLSGWSAPQTASAKPVAAQTVTGNVLRHEPRKTEQTNIVIGVRGPSYYDDDRYAADILNVILGEGMSSRLFLEIRENRGLAYDVHSFTTRLSDTGALAMAIGCDPKKAVKAGEAAMTELHKLAEDRVTESELEKAKAYSTGRLTLSLESTNGLGGFLSQQLLLTDEIITPGEIVARVNAVTLADVQNVAQKLMGGAIRASVVGPLPNVSAFEQVIGASSAVKNVVNA
jgi:predicted Zn-dependent peptidase